MSTHRSLLRHVAVVAVGVLLTVASVSADEELVWKPQRPLRWEDFKGSVPLGAPRQNVAMTAASLRWSYSYSLEWSRGSCVYEITSIETDALFDPRASWSSVKRSKSVLPISSAGLLSPNRNACDLFALVMRPSQSLK